MDLREFVSETLVQIQFGILDAQTKLLETGGKGAIAPVWDSVNNLSKENITHVQFDVAVTSAETDEKGGGGGLRVAWISVNGSAKRSTENSSVSRVSFSVPYIPPASVLNLDY